MYFRKTRQLFIISFAFIRGRIVCFENRVTVYKSVKFSIQYKAITDDLNVFMLLLLLLLFYFVLFCFSFLCTFLGPELITLTLHTYLSPFLFILVQRIWFSVKKFDLHWSGLSLFQQQSENISMSSISVEERGINEQRFLTFISEMFLARTYCSVFIL